MTVNISHHRTVKNFFLKRQATEVVVDVVERRSQPVVIKNLRRRVPHDCTYPKYLDNPLAVGRAGLGVPLRLLAPLAAAASGRPAARGRALLVARLGRCVWLGRPRGRPRRWVDPTGPLGRLRF